MWDLTQQILNKLISTSTGDINGKIIDLYDKMNSVYMDLASTSTSYTKGKIADLYTKMNNIYNELNSTSTSYMKGKINSIYSKIITDGGSSGGEFDYNVNCDRLISTQTDSLINNINIYELGGHVWYNEQTKSNSMSIRLYKIISTFIPEKTGYYKVKFNINANDSVFRGTGINVSGIYQNINDRYDKKMRQLSEVYFTPRINMYAKNIALGNSCFIYNYHNGNIDPQEPHCCIYRSEDDYRNDKLKTIFSYNPQGDDLKKQFFNSAVQIDGNYYPRSNTQSMRSFLEQNLLTRQSLRDDFTDIDSVYIDTYHNFPRNMKNHKYKNYKKQSMVLIPCIKNKPVFFYTTAKAELNNIIRLPSDSPTYFRDGFIYTGGTQYLNENDFNAECSLPDNYGYYYPDKFPRDFTITTKIYSS